MQFSYLKVFTWNSFYFTIWWDHHPGRYHRAFTDHTTIIYYRQVAYIAMRFNKHSVTNIGQLNLRIVSYNAISSNSHRPMSTWFNLWRYYCSSFSNITVFADLNCSSFLQKNDISCKHYVMVDCGMAIDGNRVWSRYMCWFGDPITRSGFNIHWWGNEWVEGFLGWFLGFWVLGFLDFWILGFSGSWILW